MVGILEIKNKLILFIPTYNLTGTNELVIELNPARIVPETDYTNNTLTVPFYVKDDVISSNEIVDVSGVEMMNFPNPAVSMTTFSIKLDKDYSNKLLLIIQHLIVRM